MRLALGIEYDGHLFKGWQWQPALPTLQGHLQQALSRIAAAPVQLFCAGRTDAGVHAVGQVAHFDTTAGRPLRAWTMGTNSHLPPTIAVQWAEVVPNDFHARFSALSRQYRYVIYTHPSRPALLAGKVAWAYAPLQTGTMQIAANYLLGEQDFSSFRSAECESSTPMRNIKKIQVSKQGHFIFIDIEANAFLHHMVRNIVGVLMPIGAGLQSPQWMQEVLYAKDRRQAGETAPACGLYLMKVTYPSPYAFPPAAFELLF